MHSVVAAMHRAGAHHHDLKLDNDVHGKDSLLRVIDFSLAFVGDRCEEGFCPDLEWLENNSS